MLVMLAIQEAEIKRISFWSHSGSRDPIWKIPNTKRGW
jgi:hypothetical protein